MALLHKLAGCDLTRFRNESQSRQEARQSSIKPPWREYSKALKAGGLLTVWLDRNMQHFVQHTGKRGRRPTVSDATVPFCLSINCRFGRALRQPLEFVQSLLRRAGLKWPVTNNRVGNAPMRPQLLGQIPKDEKLASVSADGAYETKACHAVIAPRGAQAIIPPRKNAKAWKDPSVGAQVRNQAVETCKRLGRRIWKKWSGYHRCSLVETKLYCFKRLGERVMARTFEC